MDNTAQGMSMGILYLANHKRVITQEYVKWLFNEATSANGGIRIENDIDEEIGYELYQQYIAAHRIRQAYFSEKAKYYIRILQDAGLAAKPLIESPIIQSIYRPNYSKALELVGWFKDNENHCKQAQTVYPNLVPWNRCLGFLRLLNDEITLHCWLREKMGCYSQKAFMNPETLKVLKKLQAIYRTLDIINTVTRATLFPHKEISDLLYSLSQAIKTVEEHLESMGQWLLESSNHSQGKISSQSNALSR